MKIAAINLFKNTGKIGIPNIKKQQFKSVSCDFDSFSFTSKPQAEKSVNQDEQSEDKKISAREIFELAGIDVEESDDGLLIISEYK